MEHATFAQVTEDDEAFTLRSHSSYELDVHAWAVRQAELIRLGRFQELDIENLADEVEDMARRIRKEFVSRLCLVVIHLLKWDHQPGRRGASWARTIREQRRQVDLLLAESPTLSSRSSDAFEEAFKQGRVAALNETGLPEATIPEANPYSWDDLMTRPVAWPEP